MRLFLTFTTTILFGHASFCQHVPEEEPYEMSFVFGSDKPASDSDPVAFSFVESRYDASIRHSEKFFVRFGIEYWNAHEHSLFDVSMALGYRVPIGEHLRLEVFAGPAYESFRNSTIGAGIPPDEHSPMIQAALAGHLQAKLVVDERVWAEGFIIKSSLQEHLHGEVGVKLGHKKTWRMYLAQDSFYESALGLRLHLRFHRIIVEPGAALTSAVPHFEHVGGLASLRACLTL